MKQFQIPVFIDEYEPGELPTDIQQLKRQAEIARDNAYAPYSHFRVGAAVLLDNGIIVTGSNQENAAYPSGMCAERVAVWAAGAQYPERKILKIYITARSEHKTVNRPVPPCGACRQSILEYEVKQNEPIEIWFAGEKGPVWKTNSVKNILPLIFDGSDL